MPNILRRMPPRLSSNEVVPNNSVGDRIEINDIAVNNMANTFNHRSKVLISTS